MSQSPTNCSLHFWLTEGFVQSQSGHSWTSGAQPPGRKKNVLAVKSVRILESAGHSSFSRGIISAEEDNYKKGRRKAEEGRTGSDLQSDAEVSGLDPLEVRRIDCLTPRMCATPTKHILPSAPTVNFPTVTPNPTFTPVPTITLPAAAHGSFTEMLQNWQPMDDIQLLPGD
ncbi:hypothetical protein AMELA_G00101250 [Ameiurus melas]|uniref:Uncharacterized protein n=1 Tax=Ameiurus melas TaxID=219545 RepID=A0A7J6AWR5_AMEME|nr:hypothetical protein AMELA_G00101250 [Ameiurus melas]